MSSLTCIAGSLVTTTVTFVSTETGQPADPTTITLKYLPPGPGQTVQVVVYPNAFITRVSQGVYSAELDTTSLPGNWVDEWFGTGNVQAIQVGGFTVTQAAL
jgi:hypothetical protein